MMTAKPCLTRQKLPPRVAALRSGASAWEGADSEVQASQDNTTEICYETKLRPLLLNHDAKIVLKYEGGLEGFRKQAMANIMMLDINIGQIQGCFAANIPASAQRSKFTFFLRQRATQRRSSSPMQTSVPYSNLPSTIL